jgi:hypothetical protein
MICVGVFIEMSVRALRVSPIYYVIRKNIHVTRCVRRDECACVVSVSDVLCNSKKYPHDQICVHRDECMCVLSASDVPCNS